MKSKKPPPKKSSMLGKSGVVRSSPRSGMSSMWLLALDSLVASASATGMPPSPSNPSAAEYNGEPAAASLSARAGGTSCPDRVAKPCMCRWSSPADDCTRLFARLAEKAVTRAELSHVVHHSSRAVSSSSTVSADARAAGGVSRQYCAMTSAE